MVINKIGFCTLALMFLFQNCLFSQNKISVAVLELDPVGISEMESKIVTSRFRAEVFNTKKYNVIEREKVEDILKEQGFQLSGCTSNECVVEAGKLIGVKQIIAGTIGKIGSLFTITVRLIDVESGRVIGSATEDCNCSIEKVITESIRNLARKMSGLEVTVVPKIVKYKNDKYFLIYIKAGGEIKDWETFCYGGSMTYFSKYFGMFGIDSYFSLDKFGYVIFKYGYPIKFSRVVEIHPFVGLGYLQSGWEEFGYILNTDLVFFPTNSFTFKFGFDYGSHFSSEVPTGWEGTYSPRYIFTLTGSVGFKF